MLDENHLIDLNEKLSCLQNKNLEKIMKKEKKTNYVFYCLFILISLSFFYQLEPLIGYYERITIIQGFDNFQQIILQHFLVFLSTPIFFLVIMINEELDKLKEEMVFLRNKKFNKMNTSYSILSVFFESFLAFFILGIFINGCYLQVSPKNDFFQLSIIVQILQLTITFASFLFILSIFLGNNKKDKIIFIKQNPALEENIQSYLMNNITNLDNYYLFKAYSEKNSLTHLVENYDNKIKESISKKNGFELFKDFEINELMKKNNNILTIENN